MSDKPWKVKVNGETVAEVAKEEHAHKVAYALKAEGTQGVEVWLQPKPSTKARWNALARAARNTARGIPMQVLEA